MIGLGGGVGKYYSKVFGVNRKRHKNEVFGVGSEDRKM